MRAFKHHLHDGGEIALLDAREEVPFDARHLLMAACVPLSRLEMGVDDVVPRRSVRVVWCDDGEGLAERAASRMAALGYTDVSVLQGGVAAWEAAGFRIYSGVHVPSKAFAEVVEHQAGTPWITAEQLEGTARFPCRYRAVRQPILRRIPRQQHPRRDQCSGAELVYRFADMVPSADTTVIVNCGGRTRSIIGAQSLINAGVPNKVVSLQNGTQAWHLAGFQVLKGATMQPSAVSDSGREAARIAAARVAQRFGIRAIDQATLERWRAQGATRSLYVFDVRTPEEYAAGHVPGMKQVPAGNWCRRPTSTPPPGVRVSSWWMMTAFVQR